MDIVAQSVLGINIDIALFSNLPGNSENGTLYIL